MVLVLISITVSAYQTEVSNENSISSNLTEYTTTSLTYVDKSNLTITENTNGTFQVSFWLKCFDEYDVCQADAIVRKNSVAIGTIKSTDSMSYVKFKDNITAQLNTTDSLSIGIKIATLDDTAYIDDAFLNYTKVDYISFTSPTPANNSNINVDYATINASITAPNTLKNVTFNWNNSAYIVRNNSLLLGSGFNNLAAIGENSTHAVDYSQYSNNCTYAGGAVMNTTGKYGGSIYIDGVSGSYANCGGNVDVAGMSQMSVMAWVKFHSKPNTNQGVLVSNWHASDTTIRTLLIRYNAQTAWTIVFQGSAGSNADTSFTSVNINGTGQYHWVYVEYNGSSVNLYIDNALQDTAALTGTLNQSTQPLYIGDSPHGLTHAWNGNIDELRIYSRALSSEERSWVYDSELSKHDSTSWYFSANATNLVQSLAYPYSVSITNSTDASFSTETRLVTYVTATKKRNRLVIS